MNRFEQSVPLAPRGAKRDRTWVVGLVNNTSDRARKSTERHFLKLLRAAAPGVDLDIRLFTCPETPCSIRPQGYWAEPYVDIADLFDTHLDALIVTGME